MNKAIYVAAIPLVDHEGRDTMIEIYLSDDLDLYLQVEDGKPLMIDLEKLHEQLTLIQSKRIVLNLPIVPNVNVAK